ncbi:hypothetical protein [Paeniglutamicibacter cryotolerans]|uniref:Uncharacterized protein n=1 Tax=Paeniglutamicibacter cryotolerans TaxID=670079 RepID=A0A839QJ11_9MICC|nr:hypothetical protein [Paeniglutamicibacter cryotolerans]MBB2994016.1 hypothetical protein [Paeniglutamicibacter cryotolerans]
MTTSLYLNLGLSIALVAAIVYAWLRHLSSGRGREHPLLVVRRHAWWTAFIALFASGTLGLPSIWTIDGAGTSASSIPAQDIWVHVPQALGPGLWLGAIYLLGQFTWPRQVGSARSASLRIRRMTNYVPRTLAAVFAGSVLVAAGVMAWAWGTPGTPNTATATGADGVRFILGPGYGNTPGFNDMDTEYGALGNLPGNQIAPLLLTGLLVLVAAVITMLFVITSRPALSVLDAEEDATLRTLWMNRLLRTGVLVAIGYAAAAVQFVGFAQEQRETLAALESASPARIAEGLVFLPGSIAVGALLVTALAMLFWPAPALSAPADAEDLAGGASPGYRVAMTLLTATQFVAILVLLVAGTAATFAVSGTTTRSEVMVSEMGPDGQQVQHLIETTPEVPFAGFLTPATLLLVLVVLYYILHFSVVSWIGFRLCDGRTTRAAVQPLLPRWFLITNAAMLVAALIAVALYALGGTTAGAVSAWWLAAMLAITALIGAGLYRLAQITGPLLLGNGREDVTLRIIIAHRAVRVAGGLSLICIGILSSALDHAGPMLAPLSGNPALLQTDGNPTAVTIVFSVLGVLWCFLPAATVGTRHAESLLGTGSAAKQAGTR